VLAEQRQLHAFLRDDPQPLMRDGPELCWWNFAGGRINLLLARMLEKELGGKVVARDTSLTLKHEAAASELVVRDTLARWSAERRPNAADALELAGTATHNRLSKFEPCLPDAQLAMLQADMLLR
jgi:ATP-dependent Lhr-like helicase